MLPYLARRIANYALLLLIATVLAYFLAATQLNPLRLSTTSKVCSPSAEVWAAEVAADVIRHAA